jgi:hypothetical protein
MVSLREKADVELENVSTVPDELKKLKMNPTKPSLSWQALVHFYII